MRDDCAYLIRYFPENRNPVYDDGSVNCLFCGVPADEFVATEYGVTCAPCVRVCVEVAVRQAVGAMR